jgi:hypothetical protein
MVEERVRDGGKTLGVGRVSHLAPLRIPFTCCWGSFVWRRDIFCRIKPFHREIGVFIRLRKVGQICLHYSMALNPIADWPLVLELSVFSDGDVSVAGLAWSTTAENLQHE